MTPLTALVALSLGGDFFRSNPPRPDPGPVPGYGSVHQPAYSIDKLPRLPLEPYHPQPGDVLLLSNTSPFFTFLYKLAFTGAPGHSALVVRRPDGTLGQLEAGVDSVPRTEVNPLDRRMHLYPGTIWVRRRTLPLTECQSRKLTAFAEQEKGRAFAALRFALQITPLRSRGPVRTFVVGRPKNPGMIPFRDYFCSEVVIEALVYAGVLDRRTARPAATYPEDMFFDASRNRYLSLHPPLATGEWEVPRLWERNPAAGMIGACACSSP
jgi:hypothetical protein